MKKYLSYRFIWMPILGSFLSVIGFLVGYFDQDIAFYTIALGICLFVCGNALVVFFPKPEHKELSKPHLKYLMVGFLLIATSFVFGILKMSERASDIIYYIGVALFCLGMLIQYRSKDY